MRKFLLLIAIAICAPLYAHAREAVWFAPEQDIPAVIVAEFEKAEHTIDYQLYNFTNKLVADALIRAAARGVRVRILVDKLAQQNQYALSVKQAANRRARRQLTQPERCAALGCEVRIDGKHPIAHNKVRIIDGKVLLCGSFNDSGRAVRNAENLLLTDNKYLVGAFQKNFETHFASDHSTPIK